MEYGEGVFAFIHASRGQDDSDEMDAGVVEEGKRRRFGQELDVDIGDVTNYVVVVVNNGKGRDAFV